MATHKLFIAGSGGQGILLMGQILTYGAMHEDLEASFLPSYGPEMRGGKANCTVVVSDKPISCPLIYEADALVAMNLPSMLRFEPLLKRGGKLFLNTTLIEERPKRSDIEVIDVAANQIAMELGNAKAANIVMLGALIRETGVLQPKSIEYVLENKVFHGKKANLLPLNLQAFHAWQR